MGKIPVYLITGFLGSGKTTFIKRVIDTYGDLNRIAIVQNEFAPANFDGQELRRLTEKDFDLLEINNGSVFCVCLLSGFKTSLLQFADQYNPDLIIIEASGLSDPIGVGELFNSREMQEKLFLAGSICIVDGSSFLKLEKMQQRMVRQVQIANHLLINKSDIATDIESIEKKIKELNPQGYKYITQFCQAPLEKIFLQTAEINKAVMVDPLIQSGRPDIKTTVFKTFKPLIADYAHSLIEELAIRSFRVKGYLVLNDGNVMAVQIANENIQTELLNQPTRQTELIVMSFELSPGDVRMLYRKFSEENP